MEISDFQPYSERSETLKLFLNQEGFRLTNQRHKILEIFKNSPAGHHLSAEEIYQALSVQGEKISFSTIYRALHLLVGLGLLRELALSDERKFYELSSPFLTEHHHLVCIKCGTIQEFEEPLITEVGNQVACDRGFSPMHCEFVLYVICPTCIALE